MLRSYVDRSVGDLFMFHRCKIEWCLTFERARGRFVHCRALADPPGTFRVEALSFFPALRGFTSEALSVFVLRLLLPSSLCMSCFRFTSLVFASLASSPWSCQASCAL